MADVHDKATRSRNMAAIKSRHTKPELLLRKALFQRGFRFRLHRKDLPGKPDIVLPKFNAVIFVQGCFWHGHSGCPMFRLPKTRKDFWIEKISNNQMRDERNIAELSKLGWRVLEVWECSIKGRGKLQPDELIEEVSEWITGDSSFKRLEGRSISASAKNQF